jgi:hypothetical protein
VLFHAVLSQIKHEDRVKEKLETTLRYVAHIHINIINPHCVVKDVSSAVKNEVCLCKMHQYKRRILFSRPSAGR